MIWNTNILGMLQKWSKRRLPFGQSQLVCMWWLFRGTCDSRICHVSPNLKKPLCRNFDRGISPKLENPCLRKGEFLTVELSERTEMLVDDSADLGTKLGPHFYFCNNSGAKNQSTKRILRTIGNLWRQANAAWWAIDRIGSDLPLCVCIEPSVPV